MKAVSLRAQQTVPDAWGVSNTCSTDGEAHLLQVVSQDVASSVIQGRLPGHDHRVLPSVRDPGGGGAGGHCWGGGKVKSSFRDGMTPKLTVR